MLSFPLLLYYMGQGAHIVQMADAFSRALDYPLLSLSAMKSEALQKNREEIHARPKESELR
jgi:hypothetical protein